MAKKNEPIEEKALATTEKGEDIAIGFDDLFDGFSEEEIDELQDQTGLEETEDNRRPPYIGWNQEMTEEDGTEIEKKQFYNFQTGATSEEIKCALLYVKKIRDYSYWDKNKMETVRVCRSFDMVTGQWMEGEEVVKRSCENCPHKFSKSGEKKDCTTVMKFAAWDLTDEELFIFDAKRTSFIPMGNFLERNFYKKIKRGNKRYDVPLYMLKTILKLKSEMSGSNRYYTLSPKVEGRIMNKEQVLFFKGLAEEVSKFRKEQYEAGEKKVDEVQNSQETVQDDDDVPF